MFVYMCMCIYMIHINVCMYVLENKQSDGSLSPSDTDPTQYDTPVHGKYSIALPTSI